MTGKSLVQNLVTYLDPLISGVPVVTFDRNVKRELPVVAVGYESEEGSIKGIFGHYTVGGRISVIYQGYEDTENTSADSMAQTVISGLSNHDALHSGVNVSGANPPFGMHKLFVRGTSREEDDNSTVVNIFYDAYCVAKNLF